MNIVKIKRIGHVEGILTGFGPIGPPIMSVWSYYLDGVLIDTGQSNMRSAIQKILSRKRIEKILLTHHHEDHSGNAKLISRTHGSEIYGHRIAVKKMERIAPILPYQHLIWGKSQACNVREIPECIRTDRFSLVPIHTPGHSRDHVVYIEQKEGFLFSGDLFLGDRIKFFRSDENIRQQIDSLKKVLDFDFEYLFCAHRPHLKNGRAHMETKLAFLEDFSGKVIRMHKKGFPADIIIREMGNGSDRFAKWLTFGNVSFANMVRSTLKELSH